MKIHAAFALTLSVLLFSCRSEDSSTGLEGPSVRPVAARISAGSVPLSTWTSTDSVTFKVVTTANDVLLDTGFSLAGKTGVLHLRTVSVRSDLGVTLTAKGYLTGYLLWEGIATEGASTEGQALEMRISLADTVANTAQPLGTVNAPVIDSLRTLTGGAATTSEDEPVRVFLSTLTDSATILYTLDGSAPTVASKVYRDTGVVIDSSCQLRAMAVRKRYTNSALLAQGFALQAQGVSGVSLSATAWAVPDTFDQAVTVKLSSATPNAEIRYTLDGTIPTRNSMLYTSAGVPVDSTRVLKAVVFAGKAERSAEVLTRALQFRLRPVTFSTRSTMDWFRVHLSCPSPNVVIRYTKDGTIPTEHSSVYRDSLAFGAEDSVTIRMVAYSIGGKILPSKEGTLRVGLNSASFEDKRDGQIYGSVLLRSLRWMTQNLNYKQPTKDSGWCFNGNDLNCKAYGRLYTWEAVMAGSISSGSSPSGVRGICPEGWHVPSDLEWSALVGFVEGVVGTGKAGCALKTNGMWNASTTCPSGGKDAGFHALPSGFRSNSGNYSPPGSNGNWWSSTSSASGHAWAYSMTSTSSGVKRTDDSISFGFAVRCVK